MTKKNSKISSKDIAIFSIGRKSSQRVRNKLLRNFNNTTLIDILLNKFKKLKKNVFFAANEREFETKCNKHKIRFVKRSYKSSHIDGPISEILNFLKNEKYKKFIIVNACIPFLKISTINNFISFCLEKPNRPAFSVIKKKNFFLDRKKKPINFKLSEKTINTKKTKEVYEFAHSLYYFDKKFFLKNGKYWNYNNLRYFEINDKYEQIDIDDKEDFEFAENLWKTQK